MKVKMRNTMAGPNGVYHIGEIADVPDILGRQLVQKGYAEEINLRTQVEVAEKDLRMERRDSKRKPIGEDDEGIPNV